MPRTAYAETIVHWGHIDIRIQANKPALDHLETLRAQLEAERLGLVNATNRQSALKAETQNTSREIDEHLKIGLDLATRLRDAIRAHYGRTAENLTEFGMQPRRPRVPVKKRPTETTGPNPDQTAASETDGKTQEVNRS
ncbi:MAG TPA: hypothetical protein VF179_11135 [Thermoanaerobaculia bacterium]|nr:hypothetical protein [Thermoanaerobaculia bacterium]